MMYLLPVNSQGSIPLMVFPDGPLKIAGTDTMLNGNFVSLSTVVLNSRDCH